MKVAGSTNDIVDLVDSTTSTRSSCHPVLHAQERKRIYGECTKTDCKLRTLPNVRELSLDEIGDVRLRDVDVADLLGREEIILNTRAVSGYIAGETVLVTGGGGSIGSELAASCAGWRAASSSSTCTRTTPTMLRNELLAEYDDIDLVIEIGNVCDEARLNEVFSKYRPAPCSMRPPTSTCPYGAAARGAAQQRSGRSTPCAADAYGAARFIFISTDKAVNPTSVMGATKRMGEMVMQYYAHVEDHFPPCASATCWAATAASSPCSSARSPREAPTVTHPDIERFFMTIPEASRLVIQAGGMAKGGEIFILDMGEPVKIVDLAKGLIQLQGLTPDVDVKIVFTGLREGEKMYEELLMDEESTLPTDNHSILISTGQEISYTEVAEKLDELEAALTLTDEEAVHVLEKTVCTYRHTPNQTS
ncbi:MAG: polysaccharide biosynthesis protein [Eggerthellaceae bacterium]